MGFVLKDIWRFTVDKIALFMLNSTLPRRTRL